MALYGWYSVKQQKEVNKNIIYYDLQGKEVRVTHVTDKPVQHTGWDDIKFVGELLRQKERKIQTDDE